VLKSLRAAAAALLLLSGAATSVSSQEQVTVFAAASLKTALDDAARAFTAETGIAVRSSYAASPALARQIEGGAPADLFASADVEWMEYLAARKLIRPETRVDLLGNRLILIAAAEVGPGEVPFTVEGFTAALGPDGRLATGEVSSVPIGKYAKAAFEKLGLWNAVQPRLAQAENVRAALQLVARGEARLGVVYESDARSEPKVRIVGQFAPDSHPPVIYPFAVTSEAKGKGAARLLAFLRGPGARPFFEAQGFTVLDPRRSGT